MSPYTRHVGKSCITCEEGSWSFQSLWNIAWILHSIHHSADYSMCDRESFNSDCNFCSSKYGCEFISNRISSQTNKTILLNNFILLLFQGCGCGAAYVQICHPIQLRTDYSSWHFKNANLSQTGFCPRLYARVCYNQTGRVLWHILRSVNHYYIEYNMLFYLDRYRSPLHSLILSSFHIVNLSIVFHIVYLSSRPQTRKATQTMTSL